MISKASMPRLGRRTRKAFLRNGVAKHPKLGSLTWFRFQLGKMGSHTATADVQQMITGLAYSGVLFFTFGELKDLLHLEGSTFESWSLQGSLQKDDIYSK
jgi:hypothetical protein